MKKQLKTHPRLSMHKRAGFTLVELMIAIVLGLLVVAATTELFLGGLISLRLQQGGADAQDNGLFGLDFVSKDLRLTNYGNIQGDNLVLNDKTVNGGIILTADTAPGASTSNLTDVRMSAVATDYVPNGLLTHGPGGTVSTVTDEWKALTKVINPSSTKSDQLTFQFIAPVATTDCEGAAVAAGVRVVERLFLRPDANDANSLVLACDAGRINPAIPAVPPAGASPGSPAVPPILVGMTAAADKTGTVIMSHVEHFHILLTTIKSDGKFVNYTVSDYMGIVTAPGVSKPQILGVQLAVLVRSTENTSSTAVDPTQAFKMLDQSVKVAATDVKSNHYVRRVYSSTIAIRNGFGSAS